MGTFSGCGVTETRGDDVQMRFKQLSHTAHAPCLQASEKQIEALTNSINAATRQGQLHCTACKDMIAALVSLLSDKQEQVAGAPCNITTGSPGDGSATAAAGTVPALMLDRCSETVQEQVAKALRSLAGDASLCGTVATAIPLMVRLLGSSSERVQEAASGLLRDLAAGPVFRITAAITEAGGIPALVRLMSSSSPGVQKEATGVLHTMACIPAFRGDIIAAGAVPPLVLLLDSNSPGAQMAAAGAFFNLAGEQGSKSAVAAAGAIPALVRLLGSDNGEVKTLAVMALQNLALDPALERDIIAAGGRTAVPWVRRTGNNGVIHQY